jgi:hypothetical protein
MEPSDYDEILFCKILYLFKRHGTTGGIKQTIDQKMVAVHGLPCAPPPPTHTDTDTTLKINMDKVCNLHKHEIVRPPRVTISLTPHFIFTHLKDQSETHTYTVHRSQVDPCGVSTSLVQCGWSTEHAGGRKTSYWSAIRRRSDS